MRLGKKIKGTICVRVSGTQTGRFLSVLAARGILYENVIYRESNILLDMPAGRFREAVICAKKTGVRLRILSKRGLPFWLFRQRRKKWTALLVLPMIVLVFIFPCFIWTIEIEGLKSITQFEMLNRLEKMGVKEGIWKKEISLEEAENYLLLNYNDLSFLSLSLEGTTLKVLAEESIKPPKMRERTEPCDLVAKETCIIYSIVTEKGTPVIQAGDVVQKGDLLIRGEVIQKDDDGSEKGIEVCASGEIYGKVIWQKKAKIEEGYIKKVFSQKSKAGFYIKTGDNYSEIRWPFGKCENEVSIREEIWRAPLGNVTIGRLTFEGYECEESKYTEKEMEEKLREQLEKELDEEIKTGDKIILNKNFKIIKEKEGMNAILEAELMENIGVTVRRNTYTSQE